jgi:hypothetical protein
MRVLPPVMVVSRREKGIGADDEGVCPENEGAPIVRALPPIKRVLPPRVVVRRR